LTLTFDTLGAGGTPPRLIRRSGATVAVSVLLGLFCFAYRYLTFRGFTNDHYVYLSRAQQILFGEWPIRDFLDPGFPLSTLVTAVPQALFGRTMRPEAMFVFAAFAVAAGLTCWIVVRFTGSIAAGILFTALQILILPRSTSYPKVLLYPIAVLVIARYVSVPARRTIWLLACITVVSFLMRYDHGVYIASGIAAAIAATHWTAPRTVMARALGAFIGAGLLLVAPYLVYVHRSTGLPTYVREALAFNRMESEHYPVRLPSFAVDAADALTWRPRGPTIHVEWADGVGDAQRTRMASELGLVEDAFLEGRTWRYHLADSSRAAVERIVRHPAVSDTGGVDRATYSIDDDRFDDACRLCVAAGPGLHLEQNAIAWLYYLPWTAVVAGLGFIITRRAIHFPVFVAVTVMTGLASSTFLRALLPVRVPDVWGLVPLLVPLVLFSARETLGRNHLVTAVAAAVIALTVGAVVIAGAVREQLDVAGVAPWPAAIAERTREVWRELDRGPDNQESDPAGSVTRYLSTCTASTDRLFVFSFMPELHYFTGRGFAAGYATFVRGHHASVEEQERGIARWRVQSVPFAVAYERELPEMSQSFPLIGHELQSRYLPVLKLPATNDRGSLIIFAERARTPRGSYAPFDAPCFTTPAHATSS
jgi:hypothetical protein